MFPVFLNTSFELHDLTFLEIFPELGESLCVTEPKMIRDDLAVLVLDVLEQDCFGFISATICSPAVSFEDSVED